MTAAKTGHRKEGITLQGDTGPTGMGTWATREMRKARGSHSGSTGRVKKKIAYPPPGGWTGREKGHGG